MQKLSSIHSRAGIPNGELRGSVHWLRANLDLPFILRRQTSRLDGVHNQFADHHSLGAAFYETRDKKILISYLKRGNFVLWDVHGLFYSLKPPPPLPRGDSNLPSTRETASFSARMILRTSWSSKS